MKKKVLAMVLAIAVTTVGLTGCGSTENNQEMADNSASEENSAGNTAADSGTATDAVQNLIAATNGTVKLTVWVSEEDQELTTALLQKFKETYPEVTFDITLGAEAEATAKDVVLTDVEAAADVYAFADDQINDLVKAGALHEVAATYTYDVMGANVAGAIEAATVGDKLYAYPMTADNGCFLFYDASVFSQEDVMSMEKMIEVAGASGKKIAMDISNGWYIYSFFQGAGYELALQDDGVTNTCTWNAEGATDVAQAIIDLTSSGVLVDMSDEEMATQIAEGNLAACVNGTWRAETAREAWGENYAACKLPTVSIGGRAVQLASFSGCKLIGVNPHAKNLGWSMLLAEYLTNEDSQVARYEARGLGPANIEAASSEAVAADPAISALAAQAEFAAPQRVGNNYWSPSETLGQILSSGNPNKIDLQKLLDTTVEGITAPVE